MPPTCWARARSRSRHRPPARSSSSIRSSKRRARPTGSLTAYSKHMAMVSRFDDSRLIFVRQIDHSEVVGFFAAHWGNDVFERPRPYASVALAAQEHDKGWAEWEMRP